MMMVMIMMMMMMMVIMMMVVVVVMKMMKIHEDTYMLYIPTQDTKNQVEHEEGSNYNK